MDIVERAIERGYNPDFYRRVAHKRAQEAKEKQEREQRERAEERAEKARLFRERMASLEAAANLDRMKEEAGDRLEVIRRERFQTSEKELITTIAECHGMGYADIMGASRSKAAVLARHESIAAVALAKPHLSTTQIGWMFGKDHTTIIYVLRKMGITR